MKHRERSILSSGGFACTTSRSHCIRTVAYLQAASILRQSGGLGPIGIIRPSRRRQANLVDSSDPTLRGAPTNCIGRATFGWDTVARLYVDNRDDSRFSNPPPPQPSPPVQTRAAPGLRSYPTSARCSARTAWRFPGPAPASHRRSDRMPRACRLCPAQCRYR